jgi:hypothetical protein
MKPLGRLEKYLEGASDVEGIKRKLDGVPDVVVEK